MNELEKKEDKMFIFANTFELLQKKLILEMDQYSVYPVLLVLESTVHHLSRRIFDIENSSLDEYILTTILRN